MKKFIGVILALAIVLTACQKTEDEPKLVFKLKFNPTQERLNEKGQVITQLPDTNAAQTPVFNGMSAHYIELTPNAITIPGEGERVYQGPTISNKGTVNIDGEELFPIDFSKAIVKNEDEVFFSLPISAVKNGTYPYIRVSVTYQNFDILYKAAGFSELTGTVASFVGYGQYITNLNLHNETIAVNGTKTQGFWAIEDALTGYTNSGQAPAGATTVPNPLFETSAIAEGSCLVTGVFEAPLVITGNEDEDIVVELSFSINDSFEWVDKVQDGIYEPGADEQVVDMGLRGLKPMVK